MDGVPAEEGRESDEGTYRCWEGVRRTRESARGEEGSEDEESCRVENGLMENAGLKSDLSVTRHAG